MDKDYIWQADYGRREHLRPVLKELVSKQVADSLQGVLLLVNNNPYNFEFYIMVSYDVPEKHDVAHMQMLFESAGLKRRTDITPLQLIGEMENRRFNAQSLLDANTVDLAFSEHIFFFAEKNKLEAAGYYSIPLGKTLKVFISHSSKDKRDVEQLIPFLNAADLPVWFDKYDIQIGESIVEEVQTGIENSNAVIFWITPNFLASSWCKHEMNAFIRKLIEGNSKIISILDSRVTFAQLPVFLRDIKLIKKDNFSLDEVAHEIISLFQ